MYYFNRDNIVECSESINRKKYDLNELNRQIEELIEKLSEMRQTHELRSKLNLIMRKINERTEQLERLSYTLSYAANTYSDVDRTCVKLGSSNAGQVKTPLNKLLYDQDKSKELRLAIDVEMK